MLALVIFTTWLTLTVAGFAGLTALRRAAAHEETGAGLAGSMQRHSAFADIGASIPRALLQ